jgi:hypothetical protein
VLVSITVNGLHAHGIGYANYLFVWGSVHQWGFTWQDGTLTRQRRRPIMMAAAGAVALVCLVRWGPYHVDLVGSGNTNPPSVALLAFAFAQSGLVLACEPAVTRLLRRPALWHPVRRVNAMIMNLYLWHFVPVIVIAIIVYPAGLFPQPAIGTADWWALRLAWWALLTVVLVPLVLLVTWAERPLLRLPAAIGRPGPWSPVILVAGLAAAMIGLARLAIAGLAPGGHPPVLVLAACAAGLLAFFCTGRPSGTAAPARPTAGPAAPGAPDTEPEAPERKAWSRSR